jgi:hypothetical protein
MSPFGGGPRFLLCSFVEPSPYWGLSQDGVGSTVRLDMTCTILHITNVWPWR